MASADSGAKTTTDHNEIRGWVEERGGRPARVKGTENKQSAGLLRIDYPGFSGEDTLETITWEEFFQAFDDNKLAFLYQDETKDGSESRFSKLIERESSPGKSKAAVR
ncbi:MAG TPA: hypothetical protein VGN90_04435 [Pyrinomonadaceae bacterium]|jgi:hypothetical protein|nr:hypothetical protein [Pyrinomonadaceae bacterium]